MSKSRFIDIGGKVYNADTCAPLNDAWKLGDIELHTLVKGNYPVQQLKNGVLSGIKSIGFWDSLLPNTLQQCLKPFLRKPLNNFEKKVM